MLVDDSPAFVASARRALALETGADVIGWAFSAEEAVALTTAERPNLALVDLRMPGTDGLEVTRRLKVLDPALKVVIVTLYDDWEHRHAAVEAGADGFVRKADFDDGVRKMVQEMRQDGGCPCT
ncbi:MAG: response regulator [Gemmatimonadales bacterium]